MGSTRSHWEDVYTAKSEKAVSWYQSHPARSRAYFEAAACHEAPVIDIGGGASTLVDDLVTSGYSDVTVLDVSEAALARAKTRLGERAVKVSWIVADITQWTPPRAYQVWHDRAVFHFLTTPEQQDAYISALKSGTRGGARVIIATFALDGPERCSGLPVQRYSPQTLAARLGAPFVLIDEAQEAHHTPWESEQRFSYAVFKRESN